MGKLAITGGEPSRKKRFDAWPIYTEKERQALEDVLSNHNWGGQPFPGKHGDAFGKAFAKFHTAKYGQVVNTGTVAIQAALKAIDIRPGDEVIVPAYTWEGTVGPVLLVNAVPVFVDVDPDTYCLDVASAAKAITPRTRAIIPVHLAMRFTDMSALLALAEKHSLKVIEDCAHAHGGQFEGRGAGSMGDLGCFSFQESKLMTAGEGGIVLTNNLAHFEHLQSQVNGGRASLTDQYQQQVLGSNYRMTEWQAAMLLGQLEMLPELAQKRSRACLRLSQSLAAIDSVRPLPPQPGVTRETNYCYVFQYRNPRVSRDLFCAALEAEGIPCDGRFYEPVYRSDLFCASPEISPQLRDVDYGTVQCPVSERAAYEEAVWLPQFLLIGEDKDVDDIARAIAKVLRNGDDLASADPSLAGAKAMSRAQRPRKDRGKNY